MTSSSEPRSQYDAGPGNLARVSADRKRPPSREYLVRDLLICAGCLIGGLVVLLVGETYSIALLALLGALSISLGAFAIPLRVFIAVRDDIFRSFTERAKQRDPRRH